MVGAPSYGLIVAVRHWAQPPNAGGLGAPGGVSDGTRTHRGLRLCPFARPGSRKVVASDGRSSARCRLWAPRGRHRAPRSGRATWSVGVRAGKPLHRDRIGGGGVDSCLSMGRVPRRTAATNAHHRPRRSRGSARTCMRRGSPARERDVGRGGRSHRLAWQAGGVGAAAATRARLRDPFGRQRPAAGGHGRRPPSPDRSADPWAQTCLPRLQASAALPSLSEAAVGASGRPFGGGAPRRFFGFADPHLHITADMRAGGRVISGELMTASASRRRSGTMRTSTAPTDRSTSPATCCARARHRQPRQPRPRPTFAGWPVHGTAPPAGLLRLAEAGMVGGRAAGGGRPSRTGLCAGSSRSGRTPATRTRRSGSRSAG